MWQILNWNVKWNVWFLYFIFDLKYISFMIFDLMDNLGCVLYLTKTTIECDDIYDKKV
jgi:hypothetical protein